MTTDDLFEAIGNINEKYICEAYSNTNINSYGKKNKRKRMYYAACFAFVAVITIWANKNNITENDNQTDQTKTSKQENLTKDDYYTSPKEESAPNEESDKIFYSKDIITDDYLPRIVYKNEIYVLRQVTTMKSDAALNEVQGEYIGYAPDDFGTTVDGYNTTAFGYVYKVKKSKDESKVCIIETAKGGGEECIVFYYDRWEK